MPEEGMERSTPVKATPTPPHSSCTTAMRRRGPERALGKYRPATVLPPPPRLSKGKVGVDATPGQFVYPDTILAWKPGESARVVGRMAGKARGEDERESGRSVCSVEEKAPNPKAPKEAVEEEGVTDGA